MVASEQFRVFAPLPLFSLSSDQAVPLAAREPNQRVLFFKHTKINYDL